MMQNNDDLFVNIARQNYQKQQYTYSVQRETSKKNVRLKTKLNFKGKILVLAMGVLILTTSYSNLFPKALTEPVEIEKSNTVAVTSVKTESVPTLSSVNTIKNDSITTEEEKYLQKYCNEVYGLNYNIVYTVACKLTNNFTSEEYIKTNNPAYKINKNECSSKEEGFLTFVRHLSQIPTDFGLTTEEIKNPNFVSPSKGNEEYKVKYYSELFGIEPSLVLAIEYQEASKDGNHYNSDAYLTFNNPAGLMSPSTSKLWEFISPDAGIIEHVYQLKKNYINQGLTTPEEIKTTYAPDGATNDPTNLNNNWLYGVNYFMKEIEENPNIFDYKNVDSTKKVM